LGDDLSQAKLPSAIIVGGDDNALSIARSLGGAGIQVFALNYTRALVRYSRFCRWIDLSGNGHITAQTWATYLLGPQSNHLQGSVLLAASDEAIELIAEHREELAAKFTLDVSNPAAQLCMLNKLSTYRAAVAAGVPTPKFWVAGTREEAENLKHELVFPLIAKPLIGHEFSRKFSGAYTVAHHFDELVDTLDRFNRANVRTFLVELIPGPDDKLCSYYTYLDDNGNNLLDFTKRIIRRYPANMGGSTYHITDDVPGVKELGLALFRQVGLRGIANVEFKLDDRDGQLKLIECNARFTAADCLLAASGLNLPLFVYKRLTGSPQPQATGCRSGMRLWKPFADLCAYRQLHGMGQLTFAAWVKSIFHPQTFPVFRWTDPVPSIVNGVRKARYLWSRLMKPAKRDGDQSQSARTGQASAPLLAARVAPEVQTPSSKAGK
jgi:predicted ATP-grasp superfamily ATP-dependent carboligase